MTLETHRARRVERRDSSSIPLHSVSDPVEVRSRYKNLRVGKNELELRALAIDLGHLAALNTVTTKYCVMSPALSKGVAKFPESFHVKDAFDRTKFQMIRR